MALAELFQYGRKDWLQIGCGGDAVRDGLLGTRSRQKLHAESENGKKDGLEIPWSDAHSCFEISNVQPVLKQGWPPLRAARNRRLSW